jgi:hypothetical protein
MVLGARNDFFISEVVPTAAILPPKIATAPFWIGTDPGAMLKTVPLLTIRSAFFFLFSFRIQFIPPYLFSTQ